MTTMMTTTAMAAMPMLRVVMGASQGLEHLARREGARAARPYRVSLLVSPEPRYVQGSSRTAGWSAHTWLEIDREAGSADKERPRAQPSHAPVAARPTPHDRLHPLARHDRREQLHAPAGRTT